MIPGQKRIEGKDWSKLALGQRGAWTLKTYKLPNRVSLIEIEADSKAGHAVEPSKEMQMSFDCAETSDGAIAVSAAMAALATERRPERRPRGVCDGRPAIVLDGDDPAEGGF